MSTRMDPNVICYLGDSQLLDLVEQVPHRHGEFINVRKVKDGGYRPMWVAQCFGPATDHTGLGAPSKLKGSIGIGWTERAALIEMFRNLVAEGHAFTLPPMSEFV